MKADALIELSVHQNGSHVVESFLKGAASIPAKRKLVRMCIESIMKLCINKSGSFVVDCFFKVSDIPLKVRKVKSY
jgi:hypothetical protein